MARGNSRKTKQVKPFREASDAIALPPGLAPPPGLPPPTASSRKRALKQLAGEDTSQLGLLRPPGLESIEEVATMPIKVNKAEDVETSSTTPPMYISGVPGSTAGPFEELKAISSEMYQVRLSGLPNEILGGPMFEVVLQQAHLDGCYSSYTTTLGESCGEVLIKLPTESAAEWCLYHFSCCSWGIGGSMLMVELVSSPSCEQVGGLFGDSLFDSMAPLPPALLFQEGALLGAGIDSQAARLSCDASATVPSTMLPVEARQIVTSAIDSWLSAEAHEFVPGQSIEKIAALSSKFANTSDVSTVDEDSEPDSENYGNTNVTAA